MKWMSIVNSRDYSWTEDIRRVSSCKWAVQSTGSPTACQAADTQGPSKNRREVGEGAEGGWTEAQMSSEYHGKGCMEKGKMTLVKLTPDNVGQNMHFGIPGCDTRTHSPETGSINHTRCLLLFYLWATFNHTWLVLSAFKLDHEIISRGMHKAALKSVECYKHLLICIMC